MAKPLAPRASKAYELLTEAMESLKSEIRSELDKIRKEMETLKSVFLSEI